ncbi:MAG: TauD/TfdA family dioxygenase [Ilumatobacteraceae bacterium]
MSSSNSSTTYRDAGRARAEHEALVEGTGVVAERVGLDEAAARLAEHGVVVVPSPSPDPAAIVQVAAAVLGTTLRKVAPIRRQSDEGGEALPLHNDSAYVLADLHGQLVQLRDPDDDYVLQRIEVPTPDGGDTVVIDGYALIERIAAQRPELHAFLTGVDVDFYGGWETPTRGVPSTPLLRRMVEHTRGGRRVVRCSQMAIPAPRDPQAARHVELLGEYFDVLATAMATVPHFRLDSGEVLIADNYRCLHGRTSYRGHREISVLTVSSVAAWSGW